MITSGSRSGKFINSKFRLIKTVVGGVLCFKVEGVSEVVDCIVEL